MKKLMIMLVAMAVVATVNAAAYSWKASSGRLFDGQGSESANRYAGTGYLFNVDTVSQASLLAAFASDEGVAATLTSALSTGTFSSGRISTPVAFTGPDANFTAYFAVFGKDANGNDAIYISDTAPAQYTAVGEGAIVFNNQNDYSVGFKDVSAGYSSAGWYAASVPEPTSGLLMLLGMAGLALRRRRA